MDTKQKNDSVQVITSFLLAVAIFAVCIYAGMWIAQTYGAAMGGCFMVLVSMITIIGTA